MLKNKLSIVLICLLGATVSFAQTEMSVFNATGRGGVVTTIARDYQALGINPANLALKNRFDKRFSLGIAETSLSIYSNALSRKGVMDTLLGKNTTTKFTLKEKIAAAAQFANAGTGLSIDITWVGFALTLPDAGGFAFSVKERFYSYFKLNDFASSLLFEGYNATDYFNIDTIGGNPIGIAKGIPKDASELLTGTRFNLSWTREFVLGYGTKIFEKEKELELYGGIGLKYILGFGMVNFDASKKGLSASMALAAPLTNTPTPNPSYYATTGLKPIGTGFGFELGATAIINEKWTASFALVDMGSIKYDGNVYELKDFKIDSLDFGGFDSYSISSMDSLKGLIDAETLFKITGIKEQKVSLPTKIRLGATINHEDQLDVGIDIVIPLNDQPGNFYSPIIALGGTFRPVKMLELSSGVVMGIDYNLSVPLGIGISTEGFEIGIATRDILTFFGQGTPNLSASFGVLRFRF